jgi:hypothetical protein
MQSTLRIVEQDVILPISVRAETTDMIPKLTQSSPGGVSTPRVIIFTIDALEGRCLVYGSGAGSVLILRVNISGQC